MTAGTVVYGGDRSPPALSAGSDTITGEVAPEAGVFSEVSAVCAEDTWTWFLQASVLPAAATLHIQDTESHPLALIQMHPQGYWTQWGLSLPVVDASSQQDGQSTRYACTDDTLTWRVDLLGPDGEVMACLSWGAAPDAACETR